MIIYEVISTFVVTFLVSYLLIKYPFTKSDVTERGLHKMPVPSSGGLAIFIGMLWTFIIFDTGTSMANAHPLIYPFSWEFDSVLFFMIIGLAMLLGLADDKYGLSKRVRFFVQIILTLLIIIFGSNQPIYYTDLHLAFVFIYLMVLAILTVYFINLYNFMDGIDLLASSQALFVIISLMFLGAGPWWGWIPIAAITGFMFFNYTPAKLFLGNAGSYLLATTLLLLLAQWPFHIFLILTAPFVADTTYTLVIRFKHRFNDLRSQNYTLMDAFKYSIIFITGAHKSHLYQKLAVKLKSHIKVVGYILIYNVFWCLPLAKLAIESWSLSFVMSMILLSYIPYIYFCRKYNAGIDK